MAEREAKLVVGDAFELPDLEQLDGRIATATTETIDQHAVYFDTPDLRLTRSGASLRYRSDDGWTVKLPEDRTETSLTRAEHSFAGDDGTPPEAASQLVRPWSRTAPLVEIARIDTRRSKTMLRNERGELVAELDDDRVIGRSHRGGETRFREIEIELAESTTDDFLDDIVKVLRGSGARPSRA